MTKISTQAHRQHGARPRRRTRPFGSSSRRSAASWCRHDRSRVARTCPPTGAFLLAPTHRSILDTPIAAGRHPPADALHGCRQVLEEQGLRSAADGARRFPVTRGTADREALKRCIAVLEGGEPLVLFPEGERKSGPLVQPLFDGAAYVAVKAGVPIVPVGIGGSERVMPRGAKFIHPRKVHVVDRQAACMPRSSPAAEGAARTRRGQVTDGAARRSCSACSTSPRPASADQTRQARSKYRDAGPAAKEIGILDAAQLACRVHRQLRHADVDGLDAEARRRDRADRRAARHVVAADEHLPRHAGLVARPLQQRRRRAPTWRSAGCC